MAQIPRFIIAENWPRALPVADAAFAVMPFVQSTPQSAAHSQTGLLHCGAQGVARVLCSDQAEVMRPDTHSTGNTDRTTNLRGTQRDVNAADMPSLTMKGPRYE